MKNLIEEFRWRGMLQDMMPGTEEHLNERMRTGYIGFDPTASSLHIGNLATIMLLKHLQLAGHKPVALVGGATGMIGDPSGKSEERNLLNEEQLRHNQACIKKQLEQFLSFEGDNGAVVVNNFDWFSQFSLIQFLRDVGKHLTVNYMMAKDSVKKRLETGISYTEFTYQLLQGYDFFHLWKNYETTLQMGGSDQWGNITSGTELIRRMAGGEAYAITTPLVTKADGSKFGKSESGNVWLDPTLTSPYKFYQFWINVSDDEAFKLIRVFTLLDQPSIEILEKEHAAAPHLRILQKALAEEVTRMVHGDENLQQAIKASEILFGKTDAGALTSLSESLLLEVFEGVPRAQLNKESLTLPISTLLSESSDFVVFSSKSEARKMVEGGGVSINKNKVELSDSWHLPALIHEKYLVVQKGKKQYFLLEVSA